MANVVEGKSSGKGMKVGIVVSRFNEWVTKALLEGALNELRRAHVSDTDITVVWVPGTYEIPVAAQNLIASKTLDAVITIGCVVRGETSHYEHIAESVMNGIQRVALECKVPIGLGVLTVESTGQAMARAGGKYGNRGRDAARAAVEMANITRSLKSEETTVF